MSYKLFTKEEIEKLSQNSHVQSVSSKSITYVPHHSGRWAYLSTIKDASTSEILAHNLSSSLQMPLVTDTLKKLMATGITFPEGALIHSDYPEEKTMLY